MPKSPGSKTICFPFTGDTVGGSHISAFLLIRNLDRERFAPLVVVHKEGPLLSVLEREGFPYEMIPLTQFVGSSGGIPGTMRALAKSLPTLRRFIRSRSIDAVHTQDSRMNMTWSPVARLSGCKMVWHQRSVHGRSRLASLTVKGADRVVAISQFCADHAPKPRSGRIDVVTNPFDTLAAIPDREEARYKLCQELATSTQTKIVGFVGNLTEQKRPGIFVDVAARVAELTRENVLFLIVGSDRDGQKGQLLERANQLGIGSNLRFLDFRHPVEPCIAGFDLLLAPGIGDAFGRTLVEAMLVGTPVVASASGGHLEIVEHNSTGLLTPGDDSDAFANAALALLSDPGERKRLATSARDHARATYGIANHVSAMAEIYGELMLESREHV